MVLDNLLPEDRDILEGVNPVAPPIPGAGVNPPQPPLDPLPEGSVDDVAPGPISNEELARLNIVSRRAALAKVCTLVRPSDDTVLWEADERHWTIQAPISIARNIRIATHTVLGGYHTEYLGRNPATLELKLMYAPAGIMNTPYAWRIAPWYHPLNRLGGIMERLLRIEIGGVNYGEWFLQAFHNDQEQLVRLSTSGEPVIAPRIVQVRLSFTAINETPLRAITSIASKVLQVPPGYDDDEVEPGLSPNILQGLNGGDEDG